MVKFLEIRYRHKLYHCEISEKDILFPWQQKWDHLLKLSTNLGTGCRISCIVTQNNYRVLALCYNMQKELSHSGRDVLRSQVFPHPCAERSCLAPSASSARCACRGAAAHLPEGCLPVRSGHRGGRAGMPGMPELLGKLWAGSALPVCWRT